MLQEVYIFHKTDRNAMIAASYNLVTLLEYGTMVVFKFIV